MVRWCYRDVYLSKLLGGQNNLLGGQLPTQLTCYFHPCHDMRQKKIMTTRQITVLTTQGQMKEAMRMNNAGDLDTVAYLNHSHVKDVLISYTQIPMTAPVSTTAGKRYKYKVKTSCGNDLVFNPRTQSCDWPHNYECIEELLSDQDPTTLSPTTANSLFVTDGTLEEFTCEGRDNGLHADPFDCSSFYHCWGNGRYIARTSCGNNLVFNPNTQSCDWPRNYDCSN